MKLLVVEDEAPMRSLLKQGLTEEGYAVDVASTGLEADEAVAVYEYDAVVLDVMLPQVNGFELCRRWRQRGCSVPVIFLTARDDVESRVKGLDFGADDYLVKPFAFEELLARLRVITRRGAHLNRGARIVIADLMVDTATHEVLRDGKPIPLTAREYQMLEFFATHAGEVISRTQLWEHVWESGNEPESNVVDVYVNYLREKLGRAPQLIETVRGAGYRLVARPDL